MNLKLKSTENIELVKNCLQRNKFLNAVGGRPYFAVFQLMKYILEKNNFNYDSFLIFIGKSPKNERKYSHGTIGLAIIHYLIKKGTNQAELYLFNQIDYLYNIRKKSDYYNDEVTKKEMDKILKRSDRLVQILKNYI